jgi:hypothetical protein
MKSFFRLTFLGILFLCSSLASASVQRVTNIYGELNKAALFYESGMRTVRAKYPRIDLARFSVRPAKVTTTDWLAYVAQRESLRTFRTMLAALDPNGKKVITLSNLADFRRRTTQEYFQLANIVRRYGNRTPRKMSERFLQLHGIQLVLTEYLPLLQQSRG